MLYNCISRAALCVRVWRGLTWNHVFKLVKLLLLWVPRFGEWLCVGSVGRFALRSLVMCLVSRLWIFPQLSFSNLAKFQQSSRQNSIFPDRARNSLLTRIFSSQPLPSTVLCVFQWRRPWALTRMKKKYSVVLLAVFISCISASALPPLSEAAHELMSEEAEAYMKELETELQAKTKEIRLLRAREREKPSEGLCSVLNENVAADGVLLSEMMMHTAKATVHGYHRSYQEIFTPFQYKHGFRLLEIGLDKGESLLIWLKFFISMYIYVCMNA